MRYSDVFVAGPVSLLLLLAPAAAGSQCLDWSAQGPTLPIPGGWVGDMVPSGNLLYATTPSPAQELWILDATDPLALAEVGTVDLGGPASALSVDGTYIYASVGPDVVVLDATVPTAPVIVNTISVAASGVAGLDVVGSRLWAVSSTELFHYDVTDPLNEIFVSSLVAPSDTTTTYTLRGAFDTPGTPSEMLLHVYDYASHALIYFRRINIVDPAVPVWSSLLTPVIVNGLHGHGAEYLDVRGNVAIGAADSFDGNSRSYAGFDVRWMQNPTGGTGIGFGIDSRGRGVSFHDGVTALFSAEDAGLRAIHVIDITTPLAPAITSSVPFPLFARKMVSFGNVVVLQALYENGQATGDLVSLDITAGGAGWVNRMGSFANGSFYRGLSIEGTTGWTLDFNGVESLDLSDPAAPVALGFVATTGTEYAIETSGTEGWVTANDRLEVLDLSDPSAPLLSGTYAHGSGTLRNFQVEAGVAHIATSNGYLSVDVSTPSAPVLHRQLSLGQSTTDIALWDGFAYLTTGSAVEMIDVVNNPHPEHSFTQISGTPNAIEARDGLAYVAADGLFILSLPPGAPGPPPAPTLLGSLSLPACYSLILDGDVAYMRSTTPALTYAVDISDPAAPVLIGSTHVVAGFTGVAGNGVLWGTDAYDLVAVPAHCSGATTAAPVVASPAPVLTVAPNPSGGVASVEFALPRAGRAAVTVHDVTGRRVATLLDGLVAAGRRTVTWDAGQAGGALPSGVYFVRLEAGERTVARKVVLLR